MAKLFEQAIDKLAKKLQSNAGKKPTALVGVLDPDVAQYAIYHEYGTTQTVTAKQAKFFAASGLKNPPKIGSRLEMPARPFMRATVEECSDNWRAIMVAHLKANGFDKMTEALEATAAIAVNDIQATIAAGGSAGHVFAERSPMTLELYAKESTGHKNDGTGSLQSSQPLVKTGALLNSIAWKIEE